MVYLARHHVAGIVKRLQRLLPLANEAELLPRAVKGQLRNAQSAVLVLGDDQLPGLVRLLQRVKEEYAVGVLLDLAAGTEIFQPGALGVAGLVRLRPAQLAQREAEDPEPLAHGVQSLGNRRHLGVFVIPRGGDDLQIIHDHDVQPLVQRSILHLLHGTPGSGEQEQRRGVDPGRDGAHGLHLLIIQRPLLDCVHRDTGGAGDQSVHQFLPAGFVGEEPHPLVAHDCPVQRRLKGKSAFTRRRPGAHNEVVAFLRPNHPPKLRDKPVQIVGLFLVSVHPVGKSLRQAPHVSVVPHRFRGGIGEQLRAFLLRGNPGQRQPGVPKLQHPGLLLDDIHVHFAVRGGGGNVHQLDDKILVRVAHDIQHRDRVNRLSGGVKLPDSPVQRPVTLAEIFLCQAEHQEARAPIVDQDGTEDTLLRLHPGFIGNATQSIPPPVPRAQLGHRSYHAASG